MANIQQKEIDALWREIRRLQQALAQRPLRVVASGTSRTFRITITGGNTLATGQAGIKFSSSAITNVPTAYDPSVDTSFIDGIGRGTLFINGVSQGFVLVCNDGSNGSAVNFDLQGVVGDADVINVTSATKSLTVGGDPNTTVTAYVPDLL